jgi:hypothetical protein
MDLGEAFGGGGFGFGEERQAFGVALQDGFGEGLGAVGGLLADRGDARPGGQADFAAVSSPATTRRRVVLPAPLRPTRPMRRPGSTVRSAPSSRVRPPRRMVRPEMTRRDMARGLRAGVLAGKDARLA